MENRGSGLLSRLAQYHRECFKGFIFMAVGYIEPGVKYDLGENNIIWSSRDDSKGV